MALGLLGVLDLSVVTDKLIDMLTKSRDASPLWVVNGGTVDKFTITITGSMPETVRGEGDCQVSVYLYHVSQDSYQRNSPVSGRAVPIPDQPLSLDLFYIVTASAKKEYVHEQQAMSIALRCFHNNPFVRITERIAGSDVKEEFSLTMEIESVDKLGFLWQAFSTPFRLSAVYKVSVVFLTPDVTRPPPGPPVQQVAVAPDAASDLFARSGQVFGTSRTVTFLTPDSTVAAPKFKSFDLSPAVAAPGERFVLHGEALDQPTVSHLFLLLPDETELDVTGWMSADPKVPSTKSRITLDLPPGLGLPADSPLPGVYRLRAGSPGYRTSATPFSVAARVPVPAATNPPILTGPLFTINGTGFIPGSTEVLLSGTPLRPIGGAPGAGEVNIGASVITFRAPLGISPGLHPVRIRVNAVESAPAWWINV
jgi:hypothetical protein